MKRKLIIALTALLIIGGGIQLVSSKGPPDREDETVTAIVGIEPEKLKLNSQSTYIYVNITLEKYDVSNIDTDSVVLITPNDEKISGYFVSYFVDDMGVIGVQFRFIKQDILDQILDQIPPVEDETVVPLNVEGDINSKWWEIYFFGKGTITIKT